MFKKRKQACVANGDGIGSKRLRHQKSSSDDEGDKSSTAIEKAPFKGFRKRAKLNKTNTIDQDGGTSKDYVKAEVQDLTNNYKSSAINKELTAANIALRDQHNQIDSEKDGLYYAKKNAEISKGLADGTLNPKVYRGEHGYANYFNQTEDDLRNKKQSGTLKGPQKAPSFIRSTTRMDHNPERCKDYYEHGFCGFGDTCIFIHDRGDYKSGHQLEEEYEQAVKKKQKRFMHNGQDCDSDASSNYEIGSNADLADLPGEVDPADGLPTVCVICQGDFKDPVATKCGHYFCETCALQNYSNDSNCFVCGAETHGTFNNADKLVKKLAKQAKAKINQKIQDDGETNKVNDVESDGACQTNSEEGDEAILAKFSRDQQEAKASNAKKYAPQSGWFIP